MAVISMKALLESGAHFGHRINKWDPRMKPYIFTERNGIHIIDLQQISKLLTEAYSVIHDVVANGGNVLFVGTKRQAQGTIVEEATRCGMPYVAERWMSGTLVRWSTIYQRIQELKRLEHLRDSGDIKRLTKPEGLLIEREIARLRVLLNGIRTMEHLPDMLFIIDVGREDAAVKEANQLKIPIVALVDTNCNPQNIDYVIPSNDDSIRAIKLLTSKMADAVLEGKAVSLDKDHGASDTSAKKTTPVNLQANVDNTMNAVKRDEMSRSIKVEGNILGNSNTENNSPIDYLSPAANIFISYARADVEIVQGIYDTLLKSKHYPWMDIHSIKGGENWLRAIYKAIDESDIFLAVLSNNSVSKRGVIQKELKKALDKWEGMLTDDIYIIPIRIDDCPIPDLVKHIHVLDWKNGKGQNKLLEAIRVGIERRR